MSDHFQQLSEDMKDRIYQLVGNIPAGQVSTYGDIALMIGRGIDARMVGSALNAIPKDQSATVPWQRVINAQGGISTKGILQRHLLEEEGVIFAPNHRIDLRRFRWNGPNYEWANTYGYQTLPPSNLPDGEQMTLF